MNISGSSSNGIFLLSFFLNSSTVWCKLKTFIFNCKVATISIPSKHQKMQSGGPDSDNPMTHQAQSLSSNYSDTRGKHRIHAELKRLEQEARYLEEELEQLEKMEKASARCKEMLSNVETRPDPLLPLTIGPLNSIWDRWFEAAQDSKACCRCWIL